MPDFTSVMVFPISLINDLGRAFANHADLYSYGFHFYTLHCHSSQLYNFTGQAVNNPITRLHSPMEMFFPSTVQNCSAFAITTCRNHQLFCNQLVAPAAITFCHMRIINTHSVTSTRAEQGNIADQGFVLHGFMRQLWCRSSEYCAGALQ